MDLISVDQKQKCFHCGDVCGSRYIDFEEKNFCCSGCKSIYEILKQSDLTGYYDLEQFPGLRNAVDHHKFVYLDNPQILNKLLDFSSNDLQKVRFFVPGIHCSSCIWLLENLRSVNQGILSSRVDFSARELAVDYNPKVLSLRGLVELITSIGYEPTINLENRKAKQSNEINRNLILKIAVAGFCFGNIMLLSFPEYLGLNFGLDQKLSRWFSWLMVLLSLPVVLYCARGYFESAINGIKQNYLNIDVPIVLGIIALAGRSYYEIFYQLGSGYLDSLSGLLFLLLVGRWFQNRTYSNLSFNRDYKSYFPLAVTRLQDSNEATLLVEELKVDDVILIHHKELIPADSILLDDAASIDYSFVSGESKEVIKHKGNQVYAGGRHVGLKARYQVIKPSSKSYLTQLWNHHAFRKNKQDPRELLVNNISKYFTAAVLLIALISTAYWWVVYPSKALFVFTSVLIVACPCALAMATPFTLGNIMRVFGNNKFYLKNARVINDMAKVNTIIFDKTGTLTTVSHDLTCKGDLDEYEIQLLRTLAVQSNHPVSQGICNYLDDQYSISHEDLNINEYEELTGKGISAQIDGHLVKLGNSNFVGINNGSEGHYLMIDGKVRAVFSFSSLLRSGLSNLFTKLHRYFKLGLVSGDNDSEKTLVEDLFTSNETLYFGKKPIEKLELIEKMQSNGGNVMMLGDGLNDAGALQKSRVGVAVTEQPHQFTPASDAILHASEINRLADFISLAERSKTIIMLGFAMSFLYNIVGLSFAVSGNLTPLTAAILMPLSSISVVVFATVSVKFVAMKLKLD